MVENESSSEIVSKESSQNDNTIISNKLGDLKIENQDLFDIISNSTTGEILQVNL